MPRPDVSAKLRKLEKQSPGGVPKILLGGIVIALAIVVVVASLVFQEGKKQELAASTPPPASEQARINGDATGIEVWPGKAQASAPTVEVFLDPQCPACAQLEGKYGKTLASLSQEGSIKLTYHTLSFLDGDFPGKHSQAGVNAFLCAVPTGKYLEVQEALFQQQPAQEGAGYSQATLQAFGKQAGMASSSLSAYEQCVASGTYKKFADRLALYGGAVKYRDKTGRATQAIKGTPTLLVNGQEADLTTVQDEASFRKLLLGK